MATLREILGSVELTLSAMSPNADVRWHAGHACYLLDLAAARLVNELYAAPRTRAAVVGRYVMGMYRRVPVAVVDGRAPLPAGVLPLAWNGGVYGVGTDDGGVFWPFERVSAHAAHMLGSRRFIRPAFHLTGDGLTFLAAGPGLCEAVGYFALGAGGGDLDAVYPLPEEYLAEAQETVATLLAQGMRRPADTRANAQEFPTPETGAAA